MKKHLYELLHSIASNKASELESKTLCNAHVSLEDMGLIKNVSRGKYELTDVFLNILLRQNDNSGLIGEENLQLCFNSNNAE